MLSAASPGPVLDKEGLIYLVSDPQTKLDNGRIHPNALGDIFGRGLSVCRSRASDAEVLQTWRELKAGSTTRGKQRDFVGAFEFGTSAVRVGGDDRALAVLATPLPRKKHHSEVISIFSSKSLEGAACFEEIG